MYRVLLTRTGGTLGWLHTAVLKLGAQVHRDVDLWVVRVPNAKARALDQLIPWEGWDIRLCTKRGARAEEDAIFKDLERVVAKPKETI